MSPANNLHNGSSFAVSDGKQSFSTRKRKEASMTPEEYIKQLELQKKKNAIDAFGQGTESGR